MINFYSIQFALTWAPYQFASSCLTLPLGKKILRIESIDWLLVIKPQILILTLWI